MIYLDGSDVKPLYEIVQTRAIMPSYKPKRKDAIQTRAALLKAAGQAFAQHGFQNASVRHICADAGVNLGAVSHYFGTKEALYREVLVLAHRELLASEPVVAMQPGEDPVVAFRRGVAFMLRFTLIRRSNHPHAGRIIAREIREPTAALDELISRVMQPVRQEMVRIVSALLSPSDTPALREQCTNFVISLCVFPELAGEVLKRFGQPVPRSEEAVAAFAGIVAEFALGGIRQLAALNA